MIVTVLWEDQLGAAGRFGPHELLMACLSDDLGLERKWLRHRLDSHPQKGNSNLRKTLQRRLQRLRNDGPVLAVVDRDQLHDLWPPKPPPPTCTSGMTARFRQDASGDYDLVLLDRNMETLVAAACRALGQAPPAGKPDPNERDQTLNSAAWSPSHVRKAIRDGCPSFGRIVTHVGAHFRP